MKTKPEEQFYKTFGIEPHWQYKVHQFCHFYYCDKKTIIKNAHLFKERKTCKVKEAKKVYPEITDRSLLKLICIAYSAHDIDLTIEEIKENILQDLIESKDEVKHQIQQLFKEEE